MGCSVNGMTHFEELDVSPNASLDEIHEAYKQLALLLHPDKLQDVRTRRLAESQMKRLNGVYAILSNPVKRRQYEQGLLANRLAAAPVTLVEEPQAERRALLDHVKHPMTAWVVAAVLVVAAMVWAFGDYPRAGGPPADTERVTLAPTLHPAYTMPSAALAPRQPEYTEGQVQYWRHRAGEMRAERDEAIGRVSRLESRISELTARLAATAAV